MSCLTLRRLVNRRGEEEQEEVEVEEEVEEEEGAAGADWRRL